jgi:phytoene dehydrogenase-like protein
MENEQQGKSERERWDVVVIGAGLGGLTAAACLAGSGRRVLVLERHDIAGGNATVFRRHHEGAEYEFDVGVHYIGDCRAGGLFPSILNSLGVGDRIEFRPLDPEGFDTLVLPGMEVRIPMGWDAYLENVAAVVPADRAGIERYLDVLRKVGDETQARFIPGAETPTFDLWAHRTVAELFERGEFPEPRTSRSIAHELMLRSRRLPCRLRVHRANRH